MASKSSDTLKIVLAYAAALSMTRTEVTDIATLPYPKSRIKEALVRAIGLATEASMRSELEAAYVRLAHWQEGVGDSPPASAELARTVVEESRRLREELRALTV